MRIETTRKFKVRPLDFLYYKAKRDCTHSGSSLGFVNGYYGSCAECIGCLGKAEFVGERAIFETDQLTYSKLAGVYYKNLFVDAKCFEVVEEAFEFCNNYDSICYEWAVITGCVCGSGSVSDGRDTQ